VTFRIGEAVILKRPVQLFVLLLILLSATVALVLLNQGNEKPTIHFQAVKWADEVVPEEFIEASTLPLKNEIISWIKSSANDGPIIVSESSSIKPWADEIIEDSPFDSVNIKISENEYYYVTFR
jgi:hypothetical protein